MGEKRGSFRAKQKERDDGEHYQPRYHRALQWRGEKPYERARQAPPNIKEPTPIKALKHGDPRYDRNHKAAEHHHKLN